MMIVIHNLDLPLPVCLVCGSKLANEAMAQSKLIWHPVSQHSTLEEKNKTFFTRLLTDKASTITNLRLIVIKRQEANFVVSQITAGMQ